MAKDTTGRLHVTVKTGGKRKLSSKLWLERQLNDPYVTRAKREGFRSRAAFKLVEIDDKHHLLKPGMSVVDDSWTKSDLLTTVSNNRVDRVLVAGRRTTVIVDPADLKAVRGTVLHALQLGRLTAGL